jgi:hypothetical protein
VAILFTTLITIRQKKGYLQKELKIALDILDEFPSGEIFVIPTRLANSEPSDERLQDIHFKRVL